MTRLVESSHVFVTVRTRRWIIPCRLGAMFLGLCIALVRVADAAAQTTPGFGPAQPLPSLVGDPVLSSSAMEPEPLPFPGESAPPTALPDTSETRPPEAEAARPDPYAVKPATAVPYRTVLAAPPQPSAAELVSHRKLGDHYFPPAIFVPPALTFSYFGVRAGIEYHSVPGYSRDLSFFGAGTYSPATLETINAAETVDAALRLHEYLALVGTAYGLARVGANVPTLLGTGADYTYGGDAGVLVKLFRFRGFQLAVRAQVGYYAGQQAGIIELFQDIGGIVQNNINELAQTQDVRQIDLPMRLSEIENSIRIATTAMLTPFRGIQYGGSLNIAQGIGSACGLQLSFGLYGKSATYDIPVFDATTSSISTLERSSDRFWPRLGVAFDVNLESLLMPVDLIGEYTLTRMSLKSDLPDDQVDRSWIEHLFGLGIYFAELLDLQLGVTGYILLGQDPLSGANAQAAGEPLDVGAQFVFRYTR